ncbi:alkaline phosphatase PhoX [Patulibacter americanus]|uniref:alkaline phosphatase PhoX n=1 Tax=Patulibacter americanus TaxID=588672 RepID=UPI0003B2FFF8|nr:alkaline phosphatase PhoX [Patulibacter americanus]
MTSTSRRAFVSSSAAVAGLLTFGPAFWRGALAAPAKLGEGPYGPLMPANDHGLRLPRGFASREVARGGRPVGPTQYAWHSNTDGMATYATEDGGWIVVSNSESVPGGVSGIRFTKTGEIADAYRILGDPSRSNCGGGPTPWGTWLTGEEFDGGRIWECDPTGATPAVARPALGVFSHEAAAVDLERRQVYLTEDKTDGCLYRFTSAGLLDGGRLDLTAGVLEVACGAGQEGPVTWAPVPDPSAVTKTLRTQVPGVRRYNGSEGIWYDQGVVTWTSKGDNSLWLYDVAAATVERLYDPATSGNGAFLRGPDNICVSRSGDLFVCEDNSDASFDVVILSYGDRIVAPFLRAAGAVHRGSELVGVTFSPDGERMYVGSQRANENQGSVYEITGPFRHAPVPPQPETPGAGSPVPDPAPTPVPVPVPTAPVTVLPVVPSPPAAPPAQEDVDAPGLKVSAPRTVELGRFLAEGVRVTVRTDEPASVVVSVTTSALGSAREKERRERVRPRTDTLGARRLKALRRDTRRLHPRLRASQLDRLRRGLEKAARGRGEARVRARITVQATDEAGNVRVANRTLWIVPTKRG